MPDSLPTEQELEQYLLPRIAEKMASYRYVEARGEWKGIPHPL